jgi:CRP-like cAMP-binding protein
MDQAVNVEELRTVPLLAEMSEAALERVAACAAELRVEHGQVIAMPGDPGSGMFVIRDGTVMVELRSGRLELGPGDFFGELALLVNDGGRVARVRATSSVRCLSIPREDFLALIETEPSFALHMLRELARRLTEARAAV